MHYFSARVKLKAVRGDTHQPMRCSDAYP